MATTHMSSATGTEKKPSGACRSSGAGDRRGRRGETIAETSHADAIRHQSLLQALAIGRRPGREGYACGDAHRRATPMRPKSPGTRSANASTSAACAGPHSAACWSRCWRAPTVTSPAPSWSSAAASRTPMTTPSTVYRTLDVLEDIGTHPPRPRARRPRGVPRPPGPRARPHALLGLPRRLGDRAPRTWPSWWTTSSDTRLQGRPRPPQRGRRLPRLPGGVGEPRDPRPGRGCRRAGGRGRSRWWCG